MGMGTVVGARDGRTLLLAGGRELRLAAIEVSEKNRSAPQSPVDGRDMRLKKRRPERGRFERLCLSLCRRQPTIGPASDAGASQARGLAIKPAPLYC